MPFRWIVDAVRDTFASDLNAARRTRLTAKH